MTIILSYGNTPTTIEINPPQYGYSVGINMAMHIKDTSDGKIAIYDKGVAHDYRTLSLSFLLNKTMHNSLMGFFNSQAIARGTGFTMKLGTNPTGFYPSGPDKGDVGDFLMQLMAPPIETTYRYNPWKYFVSKLLIKIVAAPSYSLPSRDGYSEGDFSITAYGQTELTGLRFPENGLELRTIPAISTVVTQYGIPQVLDSGNNADSSECDFDIVANHPNMAALVHEITNHVRGTSFLINSHSSILPFGVLKEGYDCYAKLTDSKLVITHNSETEFTTSIKTKLDSLVAQ